jgi:3-hydroxyisobutyrate dehydrogenase-like beta-hydroxyacid dehydrogenase
MLDGDFAPHATIGIFLKDLAIALDTARRYGAQTPVATAAQKVFSQAAEAFGSDLGDPAIFRLYQPKDGEQF